MIPGEPEPMSASEWETSTDLRRMLWHLRDSLTERQALLFGCACCRRIWPWLVDPRSREAVEIIEGWVDDPQGERRREDAFALADAAMEPVLKRAHAEGHDVFHPTVDASWAARALTFFRAPQQVAWQTASKCASTIAETTDEEHQEALKKQELAWHADLLREVVGDPFRPNQVDLSWVTPVIIAQGRSIYAERAFERLPALADALAEAGCDCPAILEHCRKGRPHVRGCWALELILGAASDHEAARAK